MIFVVILFAIALQIFLTIKKVNPFLSLLIVSIIAGLLLGLTPEQLLKSIESGAGSTLAGLALIICLGAALGKILEQSGAAQRISYTLINAFGRKKIQWAVMLTGFLIGIPLYYNAGFVILVPLVFTLARATGLPLLFIAVPMAASLSTTHCFLPPHPGPVILVNAFKANMGQVLLYGIVIAIPAVIIAGPVLARFLRQVKVDELLFATPVKEDEQVKMPGTFASFAIALLPVFLIALGVVAGSVFPSGHPVLRVLLFTGDSTIALLLTVLIAVYFLGLRIGQTMDAMMKYLTDAVSGIAMILLIITAGGIFKQVLIDSGTANYIASFSDKLHVAPLVFGWLMTAMLRVMIGSATVAAITAAGVVSPLVMSGVVSPELMVLAVGSGSVFGSHINDSGFWMFKEFFKLSLAQTFLSWTVMETIISIVGLAGVLLLDAFL